MDEFQQTQPDETVATMSESTECSEPGHTGEPASVAPHFDPAFEQRRRRILDHRTKAQADTDTLKACLAGVNSDLLDCELHVGETLRQVMAASSMSIDDIERNSKLIDLVLRLSKQIVQLSQLEMNIRRREEREAAASLPASGEANKSHVCAPTDPGNP